MANEPNTKSYKRYDGPPIEGPRFELHLEQDGYPELLKKIPDPPSILYGIGDPESLGPGLAVIGARRATPYGRACTDRFASAAAKRGIPIVSGGAFGCDSQAHRAALNAKGRTVAVFGGGCNQVYPARNYDLFQQIVDTGGAVVSERDWDHPALPWSFRARNRIIAGLARATLIIEAGLPSGTFSTADDALAAGREVLVVPGSITSRTSAGSNRLLAQGATPIVDDATFDSALAHVFGLLRQEGGAAQASPDMKDDPLLASLLAEPMRMDEIFERVPVPSKHKRNREEWLRVHLCELEADGAIARFPDGRYGPAKV